MRAPTETDPTVSNLLRWLGQGGATSPKFQVVSLGGGERGVFALTDLAPGEPVLRVPRRYILTVQDAMASDIGRELSAHTTVLEKAPQFYMVAFLLQERERGESSFWKPFLDSLPRAFPTVLLFCQPEELALLKGSPVQELLEMDRRDLSSKYAALCEQVPGFSRFSMDSFLWAYYSVVSRNFGWVINGSKVQFQVPLADMINEGRPFNTSWGMTDDGEYFEMKAMGAVPAGTELLTTYGNKSNTSLLLQYGYVHEENPSNEVQFTITLPADVPLAAEKQRLLALPKPGDCMGFTLSASDMTSVEQPLAFLRVLHADGPELALISNAEDPKARVKQPLSPSNEKKVIQSFISTCYKLLAGYETTEDEDDKLLRDGKLSLNARNCVLLRRGEKRIISMYARYYAVMGMM